MVKPLTLLLFINKVFFLVSSKLHYKLFSRPNLIFPPCLYSKSNADPSSNFLKVRNLNKNHAGNFIYHVHVLWKNNTIPTVQDWSCSVIYKIYSNNTTVLMKSTVTYRYRYVRTFQGRGRSFLNSTKDTSSIRHSNSLFLYRIVKEVMGR